MNPTIVPEVYVVYDKIETIAETARLERLLSKIHGQKERWVEEKEFLDKIKSEGWYQKGSRTGQRKEDMPNVIFSTFDWKDPRNDPNGNKTYEAFVPGRFAFADFRDKEQLRKERRVVCNSGYEIHSAFGCLHSCNYCHIGNALTIMLDVEKFTDKVAALMKANEWQKLYKYDNQTDILAFEPEYGASRNLVNFFATTDKTLMLYTKTANVDHLLDLKHNGRTKVCWTMSCEDVARKYELGAASPDQRIEAAKKCYDGGYGIRVRFSPIIPVAGWKEQNKDMVAKIYSAVRPEVVCLETLCHLRKEQFDQLFTGLEYKPNESITEYELFPHETRREIYEFFIDEIRKQDPDARIAPCLETERMWQDLGKLLKGTPDNFYCCCGAKCA